MLRYFSLKSQLCRLFTFQTYSATNWWHKISWCAKDNLIRHPMEDDVEQRNVKLMLADDGFEPFSIMTIPYIM